MLLAAASFLACHIVSGIMVAHAAWSAAPCQCQFLGMLESGNSLLSTTACRVLWETRLVNARQSHIRKGSTLLLTLSPGGGVMAQGTWPLHTRCCGCGCGRDTLLLCREPHSTVSLCTTALDIYCIYCLLPLVHSIVAP